MTPRRKTRCYWTTKRKDCATSSRIGAGPKDTSGSQLPLALPPPPPPPTVGLLPIPNLNKKRKEKEIVEKGDLVPEKEPKRQKITKDRGQASLVESREAEHLTDVCHPTWNPKLELDGATLP